MSEDVGITTAGKRVEDTTVAQIDMGIACYQSLEAATIDEFSLCQITAVTSSPSGHTGTVVIVRQIDVGAVFRIVLIHIIASI